MKGTRKEKIKNPSIQHGKIAQHFIFCFPCLVKSCSGIVSIVPSATKMAGSNSVFHSCNPFKIKIVDCLLPIMMRKTICKRFRFCTGLKSLLSLCLWMIWELNNPKVEVEYSAEVSDDKEIMTGAILLFLLLAVVCVCVCVFFFFRTCLCKFC